MNLRRKSKLTSEVSTHSLNDIMFFLLLFFLIASTMANPNVIKVLLPKAKNVEQVVTKKQVNLSITKDLKFILGDKGKHEITKGELKDELSNYTGTNQETTVVLHIDSEVPWGEVVEVLDLGKELNIKMVAATQKK
jgi:biopolymer transport protein ExbD